MSRRVGFLFAATATLLFGAMAAWACTNLATLNLSQAAGEAGSRIDVTGSSFSAESSGGQAVKIHWMDAEGQVLAKASPDAAGNIQASVTIPAADPGYYVLVATQDVKGEDGSLSPGYGTPARASFLVGSEAPAEVAQPAGVPAGIGAEATSGGMVALTIVLALLGLGLFGTGLGLFVREVRRRTVPAPIQRK